MRRLALVAAVVAIISAVPAYASEPNVTRNSFGRVISQELPPQSSWPYPGEVAWWGKTYWMSNGDHGEWIEFRDGVTPTDVEAPGSGVGGFAQRGRDLHLWTENGRSFSISTQSQSPENFGTLGTVRLRVTANPNQTRTAIQVSDAYLEFPTANASGPTIASNSRGDLVLAGIRVDAQGYLRLPTRLIAADCDQGSEAGRVTISAGRMWVCDGKAWR